MRYPCYDASLARTAYVTHLLSGDLGQVFIEEFADVLLQRRPLPTDRLLHRRWVAVVIGVLHHSHITHIQMLSLFLTHHLLLWTHTHAQQCQQKECGCRFGYLCVCMCEDGPVRRSCAGEILVSGRESVHTSPAVCRPSRYDDERNQTTASAQTHTHTHC